LSALSCEFGSVAGTIIGTSAALGWPLSPANFDFSREAGLYLGIGSSLVVGVCGSVVPRPSAGLVVIAGAMISSLLTAWQFYEFVAMMAAI
jgi:hypothetical protein